jgi:hypothetical protein
MWWLVPVIPATWEVEIEGLWLEVSLGKMLARPFPEEQA